MLKVVYNGFITLIVFSLTIWLHGSYYEEYEAFFNAMLSGAFTPGSVFDSWYFLGHIGLAKIYSGLYTMFPGIEWMSWIQFGYLLIASVLLLGSVDRLLPAPISFYQRLLLNVLLVYVFFADSIIHFNFTRCAYFLSGSAIFYTIIRLEQTPFRPFNIPARVGVFSLFVLGVLVRIEPSIGLILLLSPFAWVWLKSFRRAFLCMLPFGLVSLLAVFLVMNDINQSQDFYKQIEPDLEYAFGIKANIVPLSTMKTAEDSIKYLAASQMIWADPDVITVPFLKGLMVNNRTEAYYTEKWDETRIILIELFEKYRYLIFSFLILIFCITGLLIKEKRADAVFINIAFLLCFFLLVVSQIYFKKMRYRAFSPMLDFAFLLALVYNFRNLLPLRKSYTNPLFITLIFLVFSAQVHFNVASARLNQEAHKRNEQAYDLLVSVAGNDVLLLNGKSFGNFTLKFRPFEPFDFTAFHRVYVNEAQVMSLIPAYRKFLEKECQCNVANFSSFYQYLSDQKSSHAVFLLSDENRLALTMQYLSVIHHKAFRYQQAPNYPPSELYEMDLLRKHRLDLYRLFD